MVVGLPSTLACTAAVTAMNFAGEIAVKKLAE